MMNYNEAKRRLYIILLILSIILWLIIFFAFNGIITIIIFTMGFILLSMGIRLLYLCYVRSNLQKLNGNHIFQALASFLSGLVLIIVAIAHPNPSQIVWYIGLICAVVIIISCLIDLIKADNKKEQAQRDIYKYLLIIILGFIGVKNLLLIGISFLIVFNIIMIVLTFTNKNKIENSNSPNNNPSKDYIDVDFEVNRKDSDEQ